MKDPSIIEESLRAGRPVRRRPAPPLPLRRRARRPYRRRRKQVIPALVSFIDGFLPASHRSLDADLQRRGRLLVAASFGFFVISGLFGVQMSLLGHYPLVNVLIMFSGCGLAASNLLLFRVMRSAALPGALLCLEALAIQSFQAYHDLGLNDPVLLWTLVIPWLAAFLVGPKYGYVFAALIVGVTGGFYVLELQGHPFRDYTGPHEYWLFYFLCAATLAFFLGFLGWLYEGQTLKNLRTANQELAAAHADLQHSNERNEQILGSITDGFISLDDAWRFTDLNRQAEYFLRRSKHELLGSDAREFFTGMVGDEVREALRRAAADHLPVVLETFFHPLHRWFKIHVYPFSEGLTVYFNDITERKAYEKRLIEAKEEAEQLAQLKSTLLANMSHEIRTPLTSIIGFSSILAQEADGEHQEFAQLIGQNGLRLMDTLNSVLDLAQLERGAVVCHPEPIMLRDEVEQIVELLQPLAHQRGLYLRVESQADDVTALLDRKLLSRILNNLVGNAIKFTHEGGVCVTTGGDAAQARIAVADTGIGISETFLPHLFDEFRQESTGLSRAYEGSGLGLSISRRLVEAMGGTIDAESEKGVGTTFTIRFPRQGNA